MNQLERLRALLPKVYVVERQVGAGGMALVYLARDQRLQRAVAIKVLRPDIASAIGPERFLNEIHVAAHLQHPNILAVYDSGKAEDVIFCVMPFVEGESLREQLIREGQLAVEEALRITREVAEALQYAHDRRIIHRDIKPENILLQGGHALVADFGIAKALQTASGSRLTQTGILMGTPTYMSPEQCVGEELDGRSDQYSLGCVLYELLTGHPPFDGPHAMAVIAKHTMADAPGLQGQREAIPDALEATVLRMLAKSPADRYPTMTGVCEAMAEVEAALTLERSAARRGFQAPRTPIPTALGTPRGARDSAGRLASLLPPSPATVTTKSSSRVVGARVALALLLLALGGAAVWQLGPARRTAPPTGPPAADARHLAVLYFADQSQDHSLGPLVDGLTEDLIRSLATAQELVVISQNGVAPFRATDLPRDSIARVLGVGTLVTGEVERAGPGLIRVTARLVDRSGAEFRRRAFEIREADPLTMRDSLAGRVADFLRERLGVEIRLRRQRSETRSADAWVLMQRAENHRKAAEVWASQGDTASAATEFAAADSLAVLAADADHSWNGPLLMRGTIDYRRSRLAIDNPVAAATYIDRGLVFADQVLARDLADPDALELRGNLQYWRWLLRLEPDPARAEALLASARKDLEESVRLSPHQAGAWSSLSHLYYQTSPMTDVLLAARRAYEADAYLDNAATVVDRLFTASYDLDQPVDAANWCAEGHRRFPADSRFQLCRLYLMTMRSQKPDVDQAWQLVSSEIGSDPVGGAPEFQARQARMLVAAILARAGLPESAKAVIASSRADTDIDPTHELYYEEAFAQLLAGDQKAAVAALKMFLAANPGWREGLAEDPGWWFRDLASDPEFRMAVGAP